MIKKLLIIGFVWPEPKSSAAGSRMLQLINFFSTNNYSITFASACSKSNNAFNLSELSVNQVAIELNNSSFDTLIENLKPDLVLFDRFMIEEQYGWRVAKQCPNAVRILDTEDLHCLRKGRHQAFRDNKKFDETYLYNDIANREIASIFRCDLSLIISEVEIEILKNQFKVPSDLLFYIPFMLEKISEEYILNLPKFEDRHHFVTIGNFLHEPNYNAVLYLKETIWPLIKKQLPEAEMHIYGSYVSQKAMQLNNFKEGFLVKGFANEVNQIIKYAKVCLAPLRFGAGLKGKLIDAMQNGTPCIMTSIASEGMFGNLKPNGFIEDKPEEFSNLAVKLYTNATVWSEKSNNGFDIINKRFFKSHSESHFYNRLKYLESNISEHRYQNFIGKMLQHHTLQSTKYLSKWIEEKNSKI